VNEPLEEAAEKLATTIHELNASVQRAHDIRDDLNRLTKRSETNRKLIVAIGIAVAFGIIATIALVFVTVQATRNTHRINDIVRIQHDSALCPLYKLFLDADTPANRDRAVAAGQDPAERARQFAIIRQSYTALKCKNK
jgi:hypothetical protein